MAAIAAPAYAFGMTYGLLKVIGAVMPLRGSEHDEALGMDIVHHGEEAYATGEGALLISTEARSRRSAACASRHSRKFVPGAERRRVPWHPPTSCRGRPAFLIPR